MARSKSKPAPKKTGRSSADYVALDLSRYANAGESLLPKGETIPRGKQTWHGLPFRLGGGAASKKCVVAFGKGVREQPLTIPIGRPAHSVIFAHRLLDSKIPEGDPVGRVCANYILNFDDGSSVELPIRDRLETGVIPSEWGQWPILCWPDEKDQLYVRYEGYFSDIGFRQAEVLQANGRAFFLWAWPNPNPKRTTVSLTIAPKGPRFYLGGVTLGLIDEFPFNRAAKRAVKIVLPKKEDASKRFELAVEVDRGVANFPFALPAKEADAFLVDYFKGWGETLNAQSSPAYVEIAATKSATVTVKHGKETLGAANWGELQQKKKLKPSPRLELIVVDAGRNWVKTTVLDDETGKPVPCRVHFRSADGIPYQPHGHHDHVNSNLQSWHSDIGGDLRLGQITYAYIDGKCEGWLPRGEVIADIARGYEYEPIRTKVTVAPGQQELTFRLKRLRNMAKERYFSGDTHVHFLSTQGSHTEAAGEGLNVVNLLLSQWGHLFTNAEEFTGRPSVAPNGETIVYATQENRQHILGHLTLLGLKEPVNPWCTDGPSEAELGGNLETTLSRWADECHKQGGTVIIPHLPNPNCEPAALITTGRADAAEWLIQSSYMHQEYYRYLNCGYKLPIVGGTDKMSSEVPVGMYRTYVHIPDDEPFTYENWCRNLRGGNTFQSGGPLLRFKADGKTMGSTINLPGNGGSVEVEASAVSVLPIHSLEIVMNGKVVARTEEKQAVKQLSIRERIKVEKHAWLAARCAGPEYFKQTSHHDCWSRGVMAHTSPVYVAVGGEWWMFDAGTANYLLTLLNAGLDYIHKRSTQWAPGTVTHHHGRDDHEKFLQEPFRQAIEAIHTRMHQYGIPH
jgi:hypothetical protein